MSKVTDFFDDFEDVLYIAGQKARGDWEEQFVADLTERFEEWGDRMYLSDRQAEVLRRITGDE